MRLKVLTLGTTGMLGHAVFKRFFADKRYITFGAVRKIGDLKTYFNSEEIDCLIPNIDVEDFQSIINAFRKAKPDIVINCIGIIKHLPSSHNHYMSINTNSLFPHKLAALAEVANARLIHVSTDCVFNGKRGNYTETDLTDADDIYGKTKFLGEVDYPNAITLRTSIIGHELQSNISLVDWFLNQEGTVNGFSRAIYTGVTTYELANIVANYIIPNSDLHGLYHVASNKITKYDLLGLIKNIYQKTIMIEDDPGLVIDRSLLADKFKVATGYTTPSWPAMIQAMYECHRELACYEGKFGNRYRG